MAERSRNDIRRAKRARELQALNPAPVESPKVEITQSNQPLGPRGKERLLLTLGIGIADYFSRRYDLHETALLSSYGHDLLAAPAWWLVTQGFFPRSEFFRSRANIFLGTGLSFAFEGLQYLVSQRAPEVLYKNIAGFGTYRFDPYDLAAYTVGTVAALKLHKVLYGQNTPNKPTA